MKLLRESKKGFTLLELILALGIVGFIVVISLGAIRLGTSAQETGHLKVDTFQRLRLIENQLAQKIKSTYPVFVLPEESVFTSKEFKKFLSGHLLLKEQVTLYALLHFPRRSLAKGNLRGCMKRFFLLGSILNRENQES